MLILLKDEDRVINTQCISEIFIRYDNKKCEYDLICTLNQAVNGCNQKVFGKFEEQLPHSRDFSHELGNVSF